MLLYFQNGGTHCDLGLDDEQAFFIDLIRHLIQRGLKMSIKDKQ